MNASASFTPHYNSNSNTMTTTTMYNYNPTLNSNNDIPRNINDWVTHCKSALIKMETVNIQTRATHWNNIVNTQTLRTNHCLRINQSPTPYQYDCNPSHHLSFLNEWKGLKMRQITNYPRTYNEFEAKAKNWLNGRRAPNYGSSLFPDMIKTAETYANTLSEKLYPDNAEDSKLYFNVLMYAYLAALCSERITMNNASKRTPLLLENSLKYCKTQTAKMLQTYAQDHPYPLQFPSHLRQAADFFHNKYDANMNRIYAKQNGGTMNVSPHLKIGTVASGKSILRLNMLNGDKNINPVKMVNGENSSHSVSDSASTSCSVTQPRKRRKIAMPSMSSNSSIGSSYSAPNIGQNSSVNVVQLSADQYGMLLAKIDSLESSQLHQRQVIACLASKLNDLEQNNVVSPLVHIPPLPQLPYMPQTVMTPSSVPMSETGSHSNEYSHFMLNQSVMPSIDTQSVYDAPF